MPMLCGGIGEAVAADAEIQQLCDTVSRKHVIRPRVSPLQ